MRATDRVRARARVRARPRFRARGRVGARARGSSCTASRLCTCHRTHRNRPCDATRHCSCLGRACVGALTSRTPASRRAGSGSRRQTCTAPCSARRRTAAAALEEAAGCHSGRPSTRGSRRGHPARRDAGPRRERCTAHTVAAWDRALACWPRCRRRELLRQESARCFQRPCCLRGLVVLRYGKPYFLSTFSHRAGCHSQLLTSLRCLPTQVSPAVTPSGGFLRTYSWTRT